MSDLRPDIDLDALARPTAKLEQPSRFKLIYSVPILIVIVFILILSTSISDLLQSKTKVTVVRPRSVTGMVAQKGTVVLQAAGWVEPEPFAVSVSALTPGIIDELLIQDSDHVKKGQVIARLVRVQQDLYVLERKTHVALSQAELEKAKVELRNAEESFAEPTALTEILESTDAKKRAHIFECETKEAAVDEQKAAIAVAKADYETQKFLTKEGASGPWQIELAQAKMQQELAKGRRLAAEWKQSTALLEVTGAKLKKAKKDLELRLEDRLRVELAKANVVLKNATVNESKSLLAIAQQDADWCDVKSPIDGIVLTRLVMPGSMVGGKEMERAVCKVYDPKALRLRVDVPQTDIGKVQMGQDVRVTTSAKKAAYLGKVIRILDEADIQKVTLQVHVEIDGADDLIKPEMLCQARFLAPEGAPADANAKRSAITVPKRLIVGKNQIWVVDANGKKAVLRNVEIGATSGEQVEVMKGINQSDKLIDQGRESLEEEQLITIVGDK
ncbi:MAG: multidrug efflux pump subunit AcrA (membrane-fusion protein) [Planctomycetota bacterium]|jgi:multidrug efflux pump subunit AcrA (membrane-fusion protein)